MYQTFFDFMFGEYNHKYIEVRKVAPDWYSTYNKCLVRRFKTTAEAAKYVEVSMSKAMLEPYNIYYGVLPRLKNEAGTKENIGQGQFIWVDIDTKVGKTTEVILQEVQDFCNERNIKPSLLVDSGNGIHAYFKLDRIHTDCKLLERGNKLLQQSLGYDSCFDTTRVLRVPNTLNTKTRGNSLEVKLLLMESNPVNLEGLLGEFAPPFVPDSSSSPMSSGKVVMDIGLLEPHLQRYIKGGISADQYNLYGNDRDRLDFFLCMKLISRGFTEQQIVDIFTDPMNGCSSKTLSKTESEGIRYITNTIRNAVRRLQQEGFCYAESCL